MVFFSGVPEGPQLNCLWDQWRLCSALVNKWLAGQPWGVTGGEPRGGVQEGGSSTPGPPRRECGQEVCRMELQREPG